MSLELKVKSKHLSEEARIIRFEEHKLKRQKIWLKEHQKDNSEIAAQWQSLNDHRRWDVRNENRATFLARAYIAGKSYAAVEQYRKPEREFDFNTYIIPRVVAMVNKYGTRIADRKDIAKWASL